MGSPGRQGFAVYLCKIRCWMTAGSRRYQLARFAMPFSHRVDQRFLLILASAIVIVHTVAAENREAARCVHATSVSIGRLLL
jgi:hypothetical protein